MNDAQTWTLIAGFLAILSTMVAMTLRITHVEISSVRTELGGRIDMLDERLGGRIDSLYERLSGRIDSLDARLSGVEERLGEKIDHLDRDVQTVINRLMGR